MSKRTINKREKRAAILKAAAEAFKGRRYDEVKLDEIARNAGVGKGTLYLYFENKEELFVALACDGATGVAARIRAIADSAGSYRQRLFSFGREFSEFAGQRHGLIRLLEQSPSPTLTEKMHTQHAEVKKAVLHLFEQGIKEGALRDDLPVTTMECMLIGALFFRVRMLERTNTRVEVESILNFFWNAAAVENQPQAHSDA